MFFLIFQLFLICFSCVVYVFSHVLSMFLGRFLGRFSLMCCPCFRAVFGHLFETLYDQKNCVFYSVCAFLQNWSTLAPKAPYLNKSVSRPKMHVIKTTKGGNPMVCEGFEHPYIRPCITQTC